MRLFWFNEPRWGPDCENLFWSLGRWSRSIDQLKSTIVSCLAKATSLRDEGFTSVPFEITMTSLKSLAMQ